MVEGEKIIEAFLEYFNDLRSQPQLEEELKNILPPEEEKVSATVVRVPQVAETKTLDK